jgi:sugar lactone lactonase YvrE
MPTLSLTQTLSATSTPTPAPEPVVRRPEGIALDRDGSLLVADYGHDRVVRLSPDGRLLEVLGGSGSGAGEFIGPKGVALDTLSDHVYVADTGNGRVQRLASDGTVQAVWNLPSAPAATATPTPQSSAP